MEFKEDWNEESKTCSSVHKRRSKTKRPVPGRNQTIDGSNNSFTSSTRNSHRRRSTSNLSTFVRELNSALKSRLDENLVSPIVATCLAAIASQLPVQGLCRTIAPLTDVRILHRYFAKNLGSCLKENLQLALKHELTTPHMLCGVLLYHLGSSDDQSKEPLIPSALYENVLETAALAEPKLQNVISSNPSDLNKSLDAKSNQSEQDDDPQHHITVESYIVHDESLEELLKMIPRFERSTLYLLMFFFSHLVFSHSGASGAPSARIVTGVLGPILCKPHRTAFMSIRHTQGLDRVEAVLLRLLKHFGDFREDLASLRKAEAHQQKPEETNLFQHTVSESNRSKLQSPTYIESKEAALGQNHTRPIQPHGMIHVQSSNSTRLTGQKHGKRSPSSSLCSPNQCVQETDIVGSGNNTNNTRFTECNLVQRKSPRNDAIQDIVNCIILATCQSFQCPEMKTRDPVMNRFYRQCGLPIRQRNESSSSDTSFIDQVYPNESQEFHTQHQSLESKESVSYDLPNDSTVDSNRCNSTLPLPTSHNVDHLPGDENLKIGSETRLVDEGNDSSCKTVDCVEIHKMQADIQSELEKSTKEPGNQSNFENVTTQTTSTKTSYSAKDQQSGNQPYDGVIETVQSDPCNKACLISDNESCSPAQLFPNTPPGPPISPATRACTGRHLAAQIQQQKMERSKNNTSVSRLRNTNQSGNCVGEESKLNDSSASTSTTESKERECTKRTTNLTLSPTKFEAFDDETKQEANRNELVGVFEERESLLRRSVGSCKLMKRKLEALTHHCQQFQHPSEQIILQIKELKQRYRDAKRSIRNNAATLIQSVWRGFLCRAQVKQLSYSSTSIGSSFRPTQQESSFFDVKKRLELSELVAKKKSIKKQLRMYDAEFERKHGRRPNRNEKEPIRSLYETYNVLKHTLCNLEKKLNQSYLSTKDIEHSLSCGTVDTSVSSSTTSLDNHHNDAAMISQHRSSSGLLNSSDVEHGNGSGVARDKLNRNPPVSKPVQKSTLSGKEANSATANGPITTTSPNSTVSYRELVSEKKLLQSNLRAFEKQFETEHGRKVKFASDIRGREHEYRRYKLLKSQIAACKST